MKTGFWSVVLVVAMAFVAVTVVSTPAAQAGDCTEKTCAAMDTEATHTPTPTPTPVVGDGDCHDSYCGDVVVTPTFPAMPSDLTCHTAACGEGVRNTKRFTSL